MIIGISMGLEACLILGQVSHNLLYWKKNLLTDTVSQTAYTNLDVMQESRIDGHWNLDGSRHLSDSWTGFTRFTLLEEKPPNGFLWSAGGD